MVEGDKIEGQAVPGPGTADGYLAPGPWVLKTVLNWCPGGLCTSFGAYADRPRTACFDAVAGNRCRIRASDSSSECGPRDRAEARRRGDPDHHDLHADARTASL